MLEKTVKPRIDNAIVEHIADKINIEVIDYNVKRKNESVLKFNYAKGDVMIEINGYMQNKDIEPDIKTKHVVFWNEQEMEKVKGFVKKSLEERRPFITETGDGILEPVTVIKWQAEIKNIRSKGRIFYVRLIKLDFFYLSDIL